MIEELDALSNKLVDLAARVRLLRDENQALRAQLHAATAELDVMRSRVTQAMQKIDALIEHLPSSAGPTQTDGL